MTRSTDHKPTFEMLKHFKECFKETFKERKVYRVQNCISTIKLYICSSIIMPYSFLMPYLLPSVTTIITALILTNIY